MRIWTGLIVLAAWCIPAVLLAQSTSDFTVRVFGAADTEPPQETTITTLTPSSPTQIDISWATTSDNYFVFGYVLFRDGVPIATTTATSFSDTGLTPETTYAYAVTAFDGVPNYATTSTSTATSTPAVPVVVDPPTATSTAAGSATRSTVRSLLASASVLFDSTTSVLHISTVDPVGLKFATVRPQITVRL